MQSLTEQPGHEATSTRSAAILVVEIDQLPLITRQLGAGGSEVISRQLAACVEDEVQESDRVFQTGAAQFVVMIDDGGVGRAEAIARKVLAAFAEKAFSGVGTVTVSGAVAGRFPGESVGQWWRRVDAALAQAKAGGGEHLFVDRRTADQPVAPASPALQLEWHERFECGEPTIDAQHRELFERSNDILAAARAGDAGLGRQLDRLVALICRHFEDEEALLAQHGYRGLEKHRRLHAALIDKAFRLQAAAASGRAMTDDLIRFLLGEVVADHMLAEDRLFGGIFDADPAARGS